MVTGFINKLKRNWQGPAIDVVIGGQTYTLGKGLPAGMQGTSRTELIVKNSAFLRRLPISPSLAFGEAYMNGGIEVQGDLMHILEGFHKSSDLLPNFAHVSMKVMTSLRINGAKAAANARHHYDIGNDFYALWLDKERTYSCAYFLNQDDDIDTAQQQKLELICRKARLQAGNTLLDIGCGWGSLMFHAVKHHGVHATGITPANEQADFIEARARQEGLDDKIKVIRGDWRELEGKYDRIISVGMFEHVGRRQYNQFFAKWRRLLKEDGVSFLHTIGRMDPSTGNDPWVNRYIFPGGYLSSLSAIAAPIADQDMVVSDIENLWQHYDLTLQRWLAGFENHRSEVRSMFDEEFVRMWRLYLTSSIAAFRWGGFQLWQFVILPEKSSVCPLNREVNVKALLARS